MIKDVPVSTGFGERAPDVMGLRFGETRKDAVAKLQASFRGLKISERLARVGVGDSRGNRVSFTYVRQVSVVSPVSKPREDFTLRFTSDVTGGRLYRIERIVSYHSESPASLSEVRASIKAKYGQPAAVERYRGYEDITYTWEKRAIEHLPEMDMQAPGSSAIDNRTVNPCLRTATSSAYAPHDRSDYKFAAPGSRAEDESLAPCIGGIAFRLNYGRADNTVSSLRTIATDYARTLTDANLLDQALAGALDEKVKSIVGTGAPKL